VTGLLVLVPGVAFAAGLCLLIGAFRPQHVRLDDALAALADAGDPAPAASQEVPRGERVGAWWVRRRGSAVSAGLRRRLQLQGRSVERFYSDKLVGAFVGFVAPIALGTLVGLVAHVDAVVPLVASVAGGLLGFFAPDLRLRRDAGDITADATEALLTYFDLVTLERLANQSATQSLHAAAGLSDAVVFATIRGALDRARLEQRMPYAELKDVGQSLALPALVDLADVMRLDEAGASLSQTLRARVAELRDAHLTAMKMAANETSERMTVWMVLPSLVFGLIFLAPPLLKLIGS